MADLTLRRLWPNDPDIPSVLHLVQNSFAYMHGRIDPPSSMHALTSAAVQDQAGTGEVWTIGSPPLAAVFFDTKTEESVSGKAGGRG